MSYRARGSTGGFDDGSLDQGSGIDPNGARQDAGGAMDPNGAAADRGGGIDPNGGALDFGSNINPDGLLPRDFGDFLV